jgi:magnesium-protoporphyrin O-methyltransferase
MANNQPNDKQIVEDYFNAVGFDRWSKIYSDTDQISKLQRDIREGHQRTIDLVLFWLKSIPNLAQLTICDAGCGVGSLSFPLAQMGAKVFASDISTKMIAEAKQRLGSADNPQFQVQDLESLTGDYDVMICLDVLIHYPLDQALAMLTHLASLTHDRLIISFAPKNLFYDLLKKIGDSFSGANKATRAYLHSEKVFKQHLTNLGFTLLRQEFVASQFYFATVYYAQKQR